MATFVLCSKMKKIYFTKKIFLLMMLALMASTNFFALAVLNKTQEAVGPTNFNSSSANYKFTGEVGAPAVGQSVSSNFIFDHGAYWDQTTTANIQWLIQEMIYDPSLSGLNNEMIFYLTFKQSGNTIYTTPLIASTTSAGTYDNDIKIDTVLPGVYDVYVKGHQTLTKKYSNVNILNGENIFNFTQSDISNPVKGSIRLLVGDITGAGNSVATLGDDLINASDIGLVLGTFGANGGSIRPDLDHNTQVNASDIGIILKNFSMSGDQ